VTKILVIRFSSIGDIVLTTPILRCIKNQMHDVQIHYLTKYSLSDVIYNNPYVNNFYFFQDNLDQIIEQLKQVEFDFIIDLHNNLRSLKVKGKLGGKKYSFNKLNIEKWLMTNFKINKLPHQHIVDRYFEAVKPLGVINDGQGLDFFINPHDEVNPDAVLPTEFKKGYVVFAIGAKHKTKQLPAETIISLCKKINFPIVLVGGLDDRQRGFDIASASGSHVVSVCGKFSMGQSASLIKHAQLVVTHDTGMMHIAAAFRKKIISVWGNTIPEFGMYPYLPQGAEPFSIIEVKNLKCRPCSKLGYNECPKKHFRCMNDIDENEILKIVSESV
jgi:heptosyltransferase-2